MSEDKFNEDWYKKFNWTDVPFQDKVIKSHDVVVGYIQEREQLKKWLAGKRTFGSIVGVYGMGKSTLREWCSKTISNTNPERIINEIYGIENLNKSEFKRQLTKPILTSIDKIKLKLKKEYSDEEVEQLLRKRLDDNHMYLLIDEVQDLPSDTVTYLRKLTSMELPLSILICLTKDAYRSLKQSLYDRDTLKLELLGLTKTEIKELTEKLIGMVKDEKTEAENPFTDEIIAELYRATKGRPREVINLCLDTAMDIAIKGKASVKVPEDILKDIQNKEESFGRREADFDKQFNTLSKSERNIARIISKNPSISFGEIQEIGKKYSKDTIKRALYRLQGYDKKYSAKKPHAPIPLVVGKGNKRNMTYEIIDEHKEKLGEN